MFLNCSSWNCACLDAILFENARALSVDGKCDRKLSWQYYPITQSFPTQSECGLVDTCKFELKSEHIQQKVTECIPLVKKACLMNKEAF